MTKGSMLKMNSGIEIFLDHIFQYRTYGGLIEGSPSSSLNRQLIEKANRHVKEKLWKDSFPYMIDPVIQIRPAYPTPSLPAVVCLAQFESWHAARDLGANMSWLSVVWFQDDFAFPIDPQVLEHIKAVDWESLASEGSI
jgi:hypothetical protein